MGNHGNDISSVNLTMTPGHDPATWASIRICWSSGPLRTLIRLRGKNHGSRTTGTYNGSPRVTAHMGKPWQTNKSIDANVYGIYQCVRAMQNTFRWLISELWFQSRVHTESHDISIVIPKRICRHEIIQCKCMHALLYMRACNST